MSYTGPYGIDQETPFQRWARRIKQAAPHAITAAQLASDYYHKRRAPRRSVRPVTVQTDRVPNLYKAPMYKKPLVSFNSAYGGRFKKARRQKATKYTVSIRHEVGGVVDSQTECMWLGHSVPGEKVIKVLCMAITHKLFTKAGHKIRSMENSWRSESQHVWGTGTDRTYTLAITYRVDPTAALTTSYTHFTPGATPTQYIGVAETIRDRIFDLTNGTSHDMFTINSIAIFPRISASATLEFAQPIASIRCDDLMFHYKCFSNIKIQNQTLAQDAGDTTDTVTANPLQGKRYDFNVQGADYGAYVRQTNALNSTNLLSPDRDEPQVVLNLEAGGGFNYSGELKQMLSRPTTSSVWKQKAKTCSVKMNPGEVKSGSFEFKRSIRVDTLFKIMLPWLRQSQQASHSKIKTNFGKMQVYALHKLVKTGTQLDNKIIGGYEIVQWHRAKVTEMRIPCTTTVENT